MIENNAEVWQAQCQMVQDCFSDLHACSLKTIWHCIGDLLLHFQMKIIDLQSNDISNIFSLTYNSPFMNLFQPLALFQRCEVFFKD